MSASAQVAPLVGEAQSVLFLSHAGADSDAALALAERIANSLEAQRHGLRVWIDKKDLRAGANWKAQLQQALNEATAFAVYIGSKGVVNWVWDEVSVALDKAHEDQKFPLVPILTREEDAAALPGFLAQYQAVVNVEGDPDAFAMLIRAVLRLEERATVAAEKEPFLGLSTFDSGRAHLFFGREEETTALVDLLRTERLIMVVGDSGSGKSSLVKAGLVPAFRGGAFAREGDKGPDDTIWHVVETRPGIKPFRNLADAVADAARPIHTAPGAIGDVKDLVRSQVPERTRDGLIEGAPPKAKILLVVDQFEELLTLADEAEREPYVGTLLALADPPDDRIRVALTMRRDYYNLCSLYPDFYQRLEANERRARYYLQRMSDEGLRRCVTEPLRLAGVEPADREALADAVLRDVGKRAGDLALLEMALTKAWAKRGEHGGDLLKAYGAIGRVEGALAGAAEEVFNGKLSGEEQVQAEALFIRLVRLGDTGGATRRVAAKDELWSAAWRLAQKLATEDCERLVVIGGSESAETVEIAHEALVTQWPRYQSWLQASAALKRIHDWVIPTAKAWLASGRSSRALLTGSQLDQGIELLEQRPGWLSDSEQLYLKESDRAARIQYRLKWLAIASLLLLTLISLLAGGYAYKQSIEAKEEARRAEEERDKAWRAQSRVLARLSRDQADAGEPLIGVLLALEALPRTPAGTDRPRVAEAEEALYGALSQYLEPLVLQIGSARAMSGAFSPPDGAMVVTASDDGMARLWDAATGEELRPLPGHGGSVRSAAFSPDGAMVVTASDDGTARLWDAATGEELGLLRGRGGSLRSAAFSPDGRLVVMADWADTARLWDVATGEELRMLRGHGGPVRSAVFSPDGAMVVTASDDGTARLWDVATGGELRVLRGHGGPVWSAAFSPDGTRVVTASDDGTARLWDAATGEELRQLRGHGGPVRSAAFRPDGVRLVTASDDGTVRLWGAASGRLLGILRGHKRAIRSASFSPDGTRVVTASDDGTARLWSVPAASGQELINYACDVLARVESVSGKPRLRRLTAVERQRFSLGPEPSGNGGRSGDSICLGQ